MSASKSARADIQVFEKVSRFGSFLKETVDDVPSPAAATTGTAPSFVISSFLFFAIPMFTLFLL